MNVRAAIARFVQHKRGQISDGNGMGDVKEAEQTKN